MLHLNNLFPFKRLSDSYTPIEESVGKFQTFFFTVVIHWNSDSGLIARWRGRKIPWSPKIRGVHDNIKNKMQKRRKKYEFRIFRYYDGKLQWIQLYKIAFLSYFFYDQIKAIRILCIFRFVSSVQLYIDVLLKKLFAYGKIY